MAIVALVLSLLLLGALSYLAFVMWDLDKINQQLQYIVKEETNAELISTSKIKRIRQLLDSNNHLIKKNKKYFQEQKQKEKQLHELLSNLTHDLKTPLTVSSGYTQLLLKDPSLEQREMVEKIDSSLTAISHYLSYLMEYNLIQEKELNLQLEMVNVSELLKENLFTYYEEFQEKELPLSIDIAEEVKLVCDQTVLQRMFQNILGNMLKHGSDYAQVSLQASEGELILRFKNGLKGQINDSQRFFERFQTNDPSRTNKSTGLGLHIVKELAGLMDGELQLSTEQKAFDLLLTFKY